MQGKIGDVEHEDFEFKLLPNEELTSKHINPQNWTVFPLFNRHFPVNIEVANETNTLEKLFIDQHEESSSCSSSETDELELIPSGTFCVWQPTVIPNSKKNSSIGYGSKRWIIRYLLQRSNSEGKEADGLKQKRTSGEVLKGAGLWKARMSVHERFYVQRRAENEAGKRKSYLPYRKDLVGLSFANVNEMGKMLLFLI
ncbi:hypothetical protein HanXRQr2_Chr15g0685401 [Helianthus annuus]|uniref:Uncharacterized protein n=2 Tax=Helianthus annuus TaxID=4232 RepID=A0A9K3H3V3_HELAN|nr:hypothetical protein HanXRQr2_Chr15g0685401 [Helianthus annuus]KAJ0472481.1 hypothetical protein HanHA89_Chr15g0607501 [Helianthus annuus]KAJ0648082.1 hypothetical protein HanLR1_Chr15g0568861 [Helianthus annuus]